MEIKKQYCFVQFKYIYNPESSFEDVRILGNIDLLGNWQTNKAIKLIQDKKEKNSWITPDKFKIPLLFNLEYKYLIFKNNQLDKWEEISNNENRKITLYKKGHFTLLDKPKYYSTQITKEKKNLSEYDSGDLINLNYDSDYEEKKSSKKSSEENINEILEIDNNDNIIMLSFYLPINIKYNNNDNNENNNNKIDFEITDESYYNILYRITKDKKNIKWFGLLKQWYKITDEKEKDFIKKYLSEKNMFLLDIDIYLYNQLLELIQEHIEPDIYYTSSDSNKILDFIYLEDLWNSYKKFNKCIAELILKDLPKNSLIFFNDYHFLLVPNFLQELSNYDSDIFTNLSIGIFLHNSFPTFDVYKKNIFREEILISMLKCNIIGFHTFDSSKNFLTAAKILLNVNLLSTNKGDLAVNYLENNTLIRVKNVTPEFDLIKKDINSSQFFSFYRELEKKYDKNKKSNIFISIEKINCLLNIKNQLEGYNKFLENINDINKNLFLIYINIESNEELNLDEKNKTMLEKIKNLVTKIKLKYGNDVIELNIEKINYIQKLVLYAFSNCLLHINYNSNYSLGLYEFILIKKYFFEKNKLILDEINIETYSKNKEVLNIAYLVSQLSGVNVSLGGAVKINPYDYLSIYKGFSLVSTYLNSELNLNKRKEKENYLLIIKQNFLHSNKFCFSSWLFNFLKDIKNSKLSDENTFFICNDECTTQFKLKKLNKKFKKLEHIYISLNYEKSHNRLIFLDFEGTLPSHELKPTDEVIDLLNGLTKDKKNKVFIVTEKGKELFEYFKDVNNIGIGIEYGFKYIINNPEKKNTWIKLIRNYNNSWVQKCVSIITPYTERYEGSFLDIKESSVVWYYSDYVQQLGKNLASLINSELQSLIYEYNLKIINGKGYIEVIPFGIHKGYFLSHILKKQIKKGRTPDFIMCIGDDNSDEKMFNYLTKKENEIKNYSKEACLYSITVGKKPSKAEYYLDNAKSVKEILNYLVKISEKSSSSISSSIIRKSTLNLKYNIENEKIKEEK